ncbi:MAG TPA: DNA polymerase/3'-5' exonuclease PolX [Deltaproteobacteria bacterium]|nr:DNA polymerase/3'-5' exonuclease PolX [Deltaproteobacteria bacterium]HOI07785.1 DNA polymerase/3'-5' exonuclease PolX [Deltaproteobacteria bacterium]
MPMHNHEIAAVLNRTAELLEIEGSNPFRVRAYQNAARIVESEGRSIAEMVDEGEDLTRFPGIGEDLAGKIREIVGTGTLSLLQSLQEELPEGLPALMGIGGLGPKRIRRIYDELKVSTPEGLKEAAERGELQKIPGFGRKIEEKVLEDLSRRVTKERRVRYVDADEIASSLVLYLKKLASVREVVVAGSFRRRKDSVGDLDILVTASDAEEVMERFVSYEDVGEVVLHGPTKSTVLLRSGLQVDLRAVPESSYGAALHYFTGSKSHGIAVRRLGQERGLKINEYGVFRDSERVAGRTEEEVFASVGLPYIEPELREDRGEIEAGLKGELPQLVSMGDILGDLHAHTDATDGRSTLTEMVQAAVNRGYRYLAITNHSPHVTVARGLKSDALLRELDEIDRVQELFPGITILKASEVDILEDGSLDYPAGVLARLDFTVCSIHSKFRIPEEKQTERVIRAMDNPGFTIFGHPTGRLIGKRAPYEINLERVMEAALQRGCFLEVNSHPERLDLDDIFCRQAKDMGLRLAISTDAHSAADLDYMSLGINQARRGWLEKGDVINTLPVGELKGIMKRR